MRDADDLTRPRPQIHHSRHPLNDHSIRCSSSGSTPAIARSSAAVCDGSLFPHLATFKTFGVTTHGVWTKRSGGANRLVALIRFPPGADPEQLTRHIHDQ